MKILRGYAKLTPHAQPLIITTSHLFYQHWTLNTADTGVSLGGCLSPHFLLSQWSRNSRLVINSRLGILLTLPTEEQCAKINEKRKWGAGKLTLSPFFGNLNLWKNHNCSWKRKDNSSSCKPHQRFSDLDRLCVQEKQKQKLDFKVRLEAHP